MNSKTPLILFILLLLANFLTIFKLAKVETQLKDLRLQLLTPITSNQKDDPTLLAINKLSDQMANYRAEQLGRDQILGISTNQIGPIGQISPISQTKTLSLNKGWTKVEAYEKPSPGSPIVDFLQPDTKYEYLKQENSWYQIKLDSSNLAWVQAQFVHENQ